MPRLELLQCRSCDARPVGAIRVNVKKVKKLRVCCPQCREVGPACDTISQAAAGWNEIQSGELTMSAGTPEAIDELLDATEVEIDTGNEAPELDSETKLNIEETVDPTPEAEKGDDAAE